MDENFSLEQEFRLQAIALDLKDKPIEEVRAIALELAKTMIIQSATLDVQATFIKDLLQRNERLQKENERLQERLLIAIALGRIGRSPELPKF